MSVAAGLGVDVSDQAVQRYTRRWIDDPEFDRESLVAEIARDAEDAKDATKTLDVGMLDAFFGTFGRPMYVQEYFKHSKSFPPVASAKPEEAAEFVRAWHARHQTSLSRCREMHRAFLNEKLDEYRFATLYLDRDDEDGFYETLKRELVASHEYRAAMTQRLSEIHRDLYDACIDPEELEFLCQRVVEFGVQLDDERLEDFVCEFKLERDLLIEAVRGAFERVLGRLPDEVELAECVLKLRRGGTSEDVERALARSLEFQDVIKLEIERQLGDASTPRVLYSALARVIEAWGTAGSATDDLRRVVRENISVVL